MVQEPSRNILKNILSFFHNNQKNIIKPSTFGMIGVICLIIAGGWINIQFQPSDHYTYKSEPKSLLIEYINYSAIIDAIYYNYNNGKFIENNKPNLRAFHDALGILYILQEHWKVNVSFLLTNLGDLQGSLGGFFYEEGDPIEYSFPIYFILQILPKFEYSYGNLFDQIKFTQYLISLYNSSTGIFDLYSGGTSNILANWMIIYSIFRLEIESNFNLEPNREYCSHYLSGTSIQPLFSALASLYFIDSSQIEELDKISLKNKIESTFLSSNDLFDRYYGLLSLELLDYSSTIYNTTSYIQSILLILKDLLDNNGDLHSIYALLSILCLLLDEYPFTDLIF